MKPVALLMVVLIVTPIAIFGADAAGAKAGKQRAPWEWTVDERLAARFEPMAVRERQAARQASDLVRRDESVAVDGAKNPELLLPFELMTHFLMVPLTPADHRQATLERYRPFIETAGWDFDAFWDEVTAASTGYFAANERAVALHKQAGITETQRRSASTAVCAARAAALTTLRQKFDPQQFDKFLYTSVAPYVKRQTPVTMTPAQLSRIEGGCK